MDYFLILAIFVVGYAAIIFEHTIKVHKSAVALFMAVAIWAVYMLHTPAPLTEDFKALTHHIASTAQVVFFLIGAMTIVELIDAHGGFKLITDLIQTRSKRKMLWIIALVTFFLSSVLDNLTTTILMVSLLRKLIPDRKEKLLLCILVVIAANAGGAWTPIGDVTTTMLWIEGQLSSFLVMKKLFLPSLVSLLVPLCVYTYFVKGKFSSQELQKQPPSEPGARLVFALGIAGLIFVPIFKAWTGLPPFMGVLISLSVLWLVTDGLHYGHEERYRLRVPHVLTRIDISGVLFFLGILLCVGALETAHILPDLATWLGQKISHLSGIATIIGLLSAIVDNVPLVAATMGMYSLEQYPIDHSFWMMIAYAAGTGGSILIIGSSSGVALMGMEKIDFISYMKKASLPALLGYLAGMGIYLIFS
jgi:NhaD family Na+/H+ antiporter